MSEKHLTELAWKTLAVKHAVKDLGLQKALVAYAKLDTAKEPAKAIEALKEISDLALKLKKTYSAKEDVVDHLEEMVKEVKKTTPALEAKLKAAAEAEAKAGATPKPGDKAPAKPAMKPAEAEDDEDAGLDLKGKLMSAMKKVKMRKPEDPPVEALVCQAGAEFAVLMAKMVGGGQKTELLELLKKATGHKFFKGTCEYGEMDTYTFVLETVPSGAKKGLTAFFKEHTAITYKLQVRDPAGATDVDPEEAKAAATADPMGLFKKRFEGMLPGIKEAIAAAGPTALDIKLKASEAGVFANKKDFAKANELLNLVEALLKKAPAAPQAQTKPPGSPPKLSTYMNATRDWKAAKKTAGDGVFALKNAIFKECDKELEKAVKAKIDQLNGILTVMDDAIITKIQEAGNEADEERQAQRNQALADFASNVLTAVRGHPLAKVADSNPFGTFTICSPVEAVLNQFMTTFAA